MFMWCFERSVKIKILMQYYGILTTKLKTHVTQECITVGCVPSVCYRTGGLHDRDHPQTEITLDRDPPGRKPPWTETPWTDSPLDRDPPGQRSLLPLGQRPPWTETLLDRDPPYPLDRDPRTETETPLWTDRHLWKHNLRKLENTLWKGTHTTHSGACWRSCRMYLRTCHIYEFV